MNEKIAVIGAGFAGLSAASFLAKAGYKVTVFEKNKTVGGRASRLKAEGFTFDKGPSWYWMPDVFDRFFAQFGKKTADYYRLDRLDPSYRIFFGKGEITDIPADFEALCRLFESIEPGSSSSLIAFLKEAEYKYRIGMEKLVYKPGLSVTEYFDKDLAKGIFKLDVFRSMQKHVRKNFRNSKLIQLLEFPVLFLGAAADKIPALYSLMNYADMKLGTWYPEGGMYKIIEGMAALAESLGVEIRTDSPVDQIKIIDGKAKELKVKGESFQAAAVLAASDYRHTETLLSDQKYCSYSDNYWESRKMAPSCLIFFIGVNKKIKNLLHHNLFFDAEFKLHAKEIYDQPAWPTDPLFYLSCTSKTDASVAPKGFENLFVLIPTAPGLTDNEEIRERYFDKIIKRTEELTGEKIKEHIIFKQSYAHRDFINDYNAFKGNAYGLANTLRQTGILKPSMKSKKVKNLYYAGQLTVPGPGVPPALISGEVAANEIIAALTKNN